MAASLPSNWARIRRFRNAPSILCVRRARNPFLTCVFTQIRVNGHELHACRGQAIAPFESRFPRNNHDLY